MTKQLVLTLTLTILRRVPEIVRRIKEGEIVPSITALAPGLYGKTIGLIGMGDIAQETAKIFSVGSGGIAGMTEYPLLTIIGDF